tara:strand:- start:7 stop:477 length:471 start_codon:yes stop_codon:yes gene_type:complete
MNEKIKLLISDDEKHIQRIVTNMLEIDYDIEFFYADNGKDCQEILENNDIDIVISDIRMPKKTGIQVLTELKGKIVGVPFIFITGTKDVKYVVECLRLGAFDLIEKPFNIEVLIEVFNRAVEYRELFVMTRQFFKDNSSDGFFPAEVLERLTKSLV